MSIDDYIQKFRNSPEGKGVAGRAEVDQLAVQSPKEALVIARKIQHPWYRCQAITSIVEANPKRFDAVEILEVALSAAYSQAEPNRVASVSFWPLQPLVQTNPSLAEKHTKKLLQIIGEEPHSLRRLDGIRGILRGVWDNQSLRELVLKPFIETANVCPGWRADRIVSYIARDLLPFNQPLAMQLLKSRPENRFGKQILKQLSSVANSPGNADKY